MKHRLPLYGDDHAILVTAEFWENGYLLKNGGSSIRRIEIDLITRDDVPLDQFLRELESGIYQRMQNLYGITPTEEKADFLYWDEYADHANGRFDSPEVFADPEADYSSKSPRERAIHDWLLCWKLFHVCYAEYCSGYEETREREEPPVFPPNMAHHPIISCGSIDSRVLRKQDALRLTHTSKYWLDKENHGDRKLQELGFVNSTRIIFDPAMWHRSDSLFGDKLSEYKYQKSAPVYRVGDRSVVRFVDTPIRVLPPQKTDHPTFHYLVPMVTAPILTIAVIAGIKILGGNSSTPTTIYPYILGAILSMAIIGLIGWGASRRAAMIRIKMQCSDYQKYIRQTISEIRSRQKANAEAMCSSYPPVLDPILRLDLIHMANSLNSEIFSRTPEDPAFLQTRLGLSKPGTRLVPSSFKIIGTPANSAFSGVRYTNIHHTTVTPFTVLPPMGLLNPKHCTSDREKFLFDLPADIEREYSYLSKAPVMLDIGKSRLVGILTEDEDISIKPFLSNLLLDLCFHHSPDDLQIAILFKDTKDEREQQRKIRYFKHLPHFRQLLKDRSAFAFEVKQANQIMDRIHGLLRRHKDSPAEHLPHILLISEDSDWIRYHTISVFLPTASADTADNPNGITFLVCANYRRDLPQYCSQVVKVTHQQDWYLLPHRQVDDGTSESLYAFRPDVLPYQQSYGATVDERDLYFRAFKTISALSCLKFGHTEQLPMTGVLELLSAYGSQHGQDFDFFPDASLSDQVRRERQEKELERYWDHFRVDGETAPLDSLAVPVGFDRHGVATVDLHAAEMGPNMLVLSNRSAGRTEFLLTYLFSMCAHYRRKDVRMILADPIPHGLCSNAVMFGNYVRAVYAKEDTSKASADSIAGGILSIMERLLSERKSLLDTRMGIRHHGPHGLELYNQYIQDLDKHAAERLHLTGEGAKQWVERNQGMHSHLPHVFMVVDNFDLLVDLMSPKNVNVFLTRFAQVMEEGPRYGLHFILTAADLRYLQQGELLDLIQNRICLKHSNADEANRCVGIQLPAQNHYPYDGRAYLYSTANAHTAYFQTSYCGKNPLKGFVVPVCLTYAPPEGPYQSLNGDKMYSDYGYTYQEFDSEVNRPTNTPPDPSDDDPKGIGGPSDPNPITPEPGDPDPVPDPESDETEYEDSASETNPEFVEPEPEDPEPEKPNPGTDPDPDEPDFRDTKAGPAKDKDPRKYRPEDNNRTGPMRDENPKKYRPEDKARNGPAKDEDPRKYRPEDKARTGPAKDEDPRKYRPEDKARTGPAKDEDPRKYRPEDNNRTGPAKDEDPRKYRNYPFS